MKRLIGRRNINQQFDTVIKKCILMHLNPWWGQISYSQTSSFCPETNVNRKWMWLFSACWYYSSTDLTLPLGKKNRIRNNTLNAKPYSQKKPSIYELHVLQKLWSTSIHSKLYTTVKYRYLDGCCLLISFKITTWFLEDLKFVELIYVYVQRNWEIF